MAQKSKRLKAYAYHSSTEMMSATIPSTSSLLDNTAASDSEITCAMCTYSPIIVYLTLNAEFDSPCLIFSRPFLIRSLGVDFFLASRSASSILALESLAPSLAPGTE